MLHRHINEFLQYCQLADFSVVAFGVGPSNLIENSELVCGCLWGAVAFGPLSFGSFGVGPSYLIENSELGFLWGRTKLSH